jgi:beta-galactosidase
MNMQRDQQPEFGTNFYDSSWEAADVHSDKGQLREHVQAVFRAKFQVSDEDLAAETAELGFGMIDDDGSVYVNGQQIGEAHVEQMPAVFDVKPFLHSGENTIAVGVVNKGGPGGISKGVTLEYGYKTIPPHWQRSVFNGLAQVLVQSTKQSGEIKLTATAADLSPADVIIESR